MLVLDGIGVLARAGGLATSLVAQVVTTVVRVFVGLVALLWYGLELVFGFERSVSEFGSAFTCGILAVVGLAVVCGKYDVARGVYDFFDPMLEALDAVVVRLSAVLWYPKDGSGGGEQDDYGEADGVVLRRQPLDYEDPSLASLLGPAAVAPVGWTPGLSVLGGAQNDERTDSLCYVRYRSPSASGNATHQDRRSSHLFNGASTADFAALGVPRSLVYPSTAALSSRLQQHGVGTQQSSNNTFRLLQQGNVSEFSAALTVAEANNNNNDVTDNVAGETTQHTGYSRQFHRFATEQEESNLLHPNDLRPSAPPLYPSVSAESIWAKGWENRLTHQFNNTQRSSPVLGALGTATRAGNQLQKTSYPNYQADSATPKLLHGIGSSTRDVSVAVSKSLTKLRRLRRAQLRTRRKKELKQTPSTSVTTSTTTNGMKSKACIVCQEASKCMIVMPCRHLSCCEACIKQILEQEKKCPICREPVNDSFKVFT